MYYMKKDLSAEADKIAKTLKGDEVFQTKFHTGGIVATTEAMHTLSAACKSGAFTVNEFKQALGVMNELSPIKELKSRCSALGQTVAAPCICHEEEDTNLESLLIHLNDDLRWTREEIADWLESLDVDLSVVIE